MSFCSRAFLFCLATALAGCTPSRDSRRPVPVTLAFLTGLRGTTAPCGCTSKPLGGIDRIATQVAELRREGPFALFLVGDTFYTEADPPAHLREQEEKKAHLIAEVLERLQPAALLPGPTDVAHLEAVRRLAAEHGLPLMLPPRTPTTRLRPDSTILSFGGLRLGILGIPGAPEREQMSYAAGAVALRAQGVDFVVGLLGLSGADAQSFVQRTRAMNVVVGTGAAKATDAAMVHSTLFVEAREKGQVLGLLRLHRPRGPRTEDWVYDDGGRGARSRLGARIERLRADIARITDATARAARATKLAELERELAGIDDARPTGPYVTWDLDPITKSIAPAKWAQAKVAAYNRSLCAITRRATEGLRCPEAATAAERYAGNEACADCHADADAFHRKTKHAGAWATLTAAGKECDLGCIGCHSVGYDEPGGYCRLTDASHHANVGCESCHGPGAGHAEDPDDASAWGSRFVASPGESTCRHCHTPEHSDLFDFATYRRQIIGPGHGKPSSE